MNALLYTYADFLFWSGVVLAIFGAIWMLFAAYQCDASMARWMVFFPPFVLYFIIRYPRECVRPFTVCIVAAILTVTGLAFATVNAARRLDVTVPGLSPN